MILSLLMIASLSSMVHAQLPTEELSIDAPSVPAQCTGDWDARFTTLGTNGHVSAITTSGTDVYIGGDFTMVNGIRANGIAKWDGQKWLAVGSGVTNGQVRSIVVSGSDLYIGGEFTTSGSGGSLLRLARFDGTNWVSMGNPNGSVNAMAMVGGHLYVGGQFTQIGGNPIAYLSMWNGSSWTSVGSGLNNTVSALGVNGGSLYVGGFFTQAGGAPANFVAKWSSGSWSALGTGFNNAPDTIVSHNGDVYFGGGFTSAGGVTANRIAKWNGTSFSAIGNGFSNSVKGIAFKNNEIYAAGGFLEFGSENLFFIAKWNGSAWKPVNGGFNNPVFALASGTDFVYAGGLLTSTADGPLNGIGRWDGVVWSEMGTRGVGLDDTVTDFGIDGSVIYAGGNFTFSDDRYLPYLAEWRGTHWQPVQNGPNGPVTAIYVQGNRVYVGGSFTQAGNTPASGIALYHRDTQTWDNLGGGINGVVLSIERHGGRIYAGGTFTQAGGQPANNIAVWSGSSWTQLGGGLNDTVHIIKEHGSKLFIGGDFTNAGGTGADYITEWLHNHWVKLGNGLDGPVLDLGSHGSGLLTGGSFQNSGMTALKSVGLWNGTTWVNLGTGVDLGTVYGVASIANSFYIAGDFTSVAGISANHIARWNGSNWTAMGDGLDAPAYTIGRQEGNIIVGGTFSRAGCFQSAHFARHITEEFNGISDSNWHNGANWTSVSVPDQDTQLVIKNNVSITSNDAEARDIQVNRDKTLTIGAGRTLHVYGNLTVLGKITGGGTVYVPNCDSEAVMRTLDVGHIETPLIRCVNNEYRSYVFPVGTSTGYAPITLEKPSGADLISVQTYSGAYTGPAAGLPTNRLGRWWNISSSLAPPSPATTGLTEKPTGFPGIAAVDVIFSYPSSELTLGNPLTYKAWRISGGVATNQGGTNDTVIHRLKAVGINQLSDWTLAQGAPSAAPASVVGRVLDANGRGIGNASVMLTGPDGEVVTVRTNNFGHYRFGGIRSGETYVLMAQSRQHLYMPKVISVSEDLAYLDFRP